MISDAKRQQELAACVRRLAGEAGLLDASAQRLDGARAALAALPALPGVAAEALRSVDLLAVERSLLTGQPVADPFALAAYEAIVLPKERPALRIFEDRVFFDDGDWRLLPSVLRDALDPADPGGVLHRAVSAVARVEKGDPPRHIGTAFVVGPDLMLTNRHVVAKFEDWDRSRPELAPRVAFGHERAEGETGAAPEPEVRAGTVCRVVDVVWVHPWWDAALLRVEGLDGRPIFTLNAEQVPAGRPVAVVGYPAKEYGDEAYELVQEILFRGRFGVKRLQPGLLGGLVDFPSSTPDATPRVLEHDASTLGGNSGSVVIDLRTGLVVGMHFAGSRYYVNYAVPTFELAREPRARAAGLRFQPPAEPPGPPPAWALGSG